MNMVDFEGGHDGRAPEWDAARRALAHATPPDRVEDALLRAFARQHAPLPWYRRWNVDALASWAGIGALGCALAITGMGVLAPGAPGGVAPVIAAAGDGFVPLVTLEQMAAAGPPQLKQADLPRAALVQLGIPIVADAPNELVHAELIVAATGEPLAIRLAVN